MSVVKKIVGGILGPGDAPQEAAQVQAQAATEAGRLQAEAARQAIKEQRRQFDVTQGQLEPFRQAELRQLEQRQALLGTLGPEQQEAALAAFRESPAQRFIRERAERTLLRNASAIGGLGGGNVRAGLAELGAGLASQNLNQRIDQLAGQPSATLGLAGLGQQTAANIGGIQQSGAQARASGILGAGQAGAQGILGAQQAASGLGQQLIGAGVGAGLGSAGLLGSGIGAGAGALFGLLSDIRLKTNIEKIGELESGLGWYKWDWTEEGKEIAGDQSSEGVLAQEAKQMFPDSVIEVDGYLRVKYEEIH